MVYRVYVEKKKEHGFEARDLLRNLRSFVGIEGLKVVRIINRYDVENITEELFKTAVQNVFSEPQLDDVFDALPQGADAVFSTEYLPASLTSGPTPPSSAFPSYPAARDPLSAQQNAISSSATLPPRMLKR